MLETGVCIYTKIGRGCEFTSPQYRHRQVSRDNGFRDLIFDWQEMAMRKTRKPWEAVHGGRWWKSTAFDKSLIGIGLRN